MEKTVSGIEFKLNVKLAWFGEVPGHKKVDIFDRMSVKLESNEDLHMIVGVLAKVWPDGEQLLTQMQRCLVFLPLADPNQFHHLLQSVICW